MRAVRADDDLALTADPSQEWLPVEVQRKTGSTWTKVAEGYTAEPPNQGRYQTVLTGSPMSNSRRPCANQANGMIVPEKRSDG